MKCNKRDLLDVMLQVLLLLFEADKKEDLIPYSDFYNDAISEYANLEVKMLLLEFGIVCAMR